MTFDCFSVQHVRYFLRWKQVIANSHIVINLYERTWSVHKTSGSRIERKIISEQMFQSIRLFLEGEHCECLSVNKAKENNLSFSLQRIKPSPQTVKTF